MHYEVIMKCGHIDDVQLFGPDDERKRKLHWAGCEMLCRECYKELKKDEQDKQPVRLTGAQLPFKSPKGDKMVILWLEGNTKESKKKIAEAGYRWGRPVLPRGNKQGVPMRFCWSKEIPLSKVEQELRKAADFALISVGEELTDESASPENKTSQNRAEGKWQQERAALQKRLDELQEPERPMLLVGEGHWNRKIYGGRGNRSIYLDGEKYEISDGDAVDLEEYAEAYEEYLDKKKELIHKLRTM